MNNQLQREIARWQAEVDAEAARLIREGWPPHRAIDQAREIVSARRSGGYCDLRPA